MLSVVLASHWPNIAIPGKLVWEIRGSEKNNESSNIGRYEQVQWTVWVRLR